MVAAGRFALALAQLLDFAYSTIRQVRSDADIEGQIAGNGIARTIVQSRMSFAFDSDVSFKMTTDADGIASIGSETRGVHDGGLSMARDVFARIPVASFAGDAAVQKRQALVSVDRARDAGLDRAHVTSQATTLHRQGRGNVIDLRQSGLQVITAGRRVPRHGRLEKEIAGGIEIGGTQMTRPEKIKQGDFSRRLRIAKGP